METSTTAVNFKKGDKVKLLKSYKGIERHSNGWINSWVSDMDQVVGKVGTVVNYIPERKDVIVEFQGISNFGYPDFALELVPAVKPPCTTEFTVGQRVKTKFGETGTVNKIDHEYVYVKSDRRGFSGGWFPKNVEALVTPTTTEVKVDSQTTAVVTPKLEPIVGARVRVIYPNGITWNGYEGKVNSIDNKSVWPYAILMQTGPNAGETGYFKQIEFEVLSVPVVAKTTIPAPKTVNKNAVLLLARDAAKTIALNSFNSRVNMDQVQDELAKKGYKSSDLGNAAGQVFNKSNWKNTGVTVKSTRPGNHSRRITVWELTR